MFFLRNFKNFTEAKLSFDEPVTLLVGPNGAGKSNLIEAVEMLCFLAASRPLHEITDLGRQGGLEVRGGLDACAQRGKDEFTLGYEGDVETEEGRQVVEYTITIRTAHHERTLARLGATSACVRNTAFVHAGLVGEQQGALRQPCTRQK